LPRFPNVSEHAHSASHRVYSNLEQRALAEKQHIYRLHVGDTYRDPVPAAQAERQLSSEHPGLHNYAPVHGEPSLIDAFIAYVEGRHGETLNPDLVQVMSGATAGLSVVCQVLLELGDEVLLPSPFWPLSRGVIATKGAVPVQVPFYTRLDEPGFDAEAVLERAITDRTVALYINTPHNPTGRVLCGATIDAMMRVAKRHETRRTRRSTSTANHQTPCGSAPTSGTGLSRFTHCPRPTDLRERGSVSPTVPKAS